MRRHAKAASSGSTMRQALLGALACLFVFAATAASASATTVTQRPLLFTFNGSDTTGGTFRSAHSIAVDNSTGAVYVGEGFPPEFSDPNYLDKFHPDGTAWPFSSSGLSSIGSQMSGEENGRNLSLAVDNTSTASQGRLLIGARAIFGSSAYAEALESSGQPLWAFRPKNGNISIELADAAIDQAGHYWLANRANEAIEYDNVGSPPAKIGSVALPSSPTALDFDAAGNMYVVREGRLEKWTGGAYSSTIDPHATNVYVDQSRLGGHIFTVNRTDERQEVVVSATAGQFRLSFGGEQTADLPFNASPDQVRNALEGLPSVGPNTIQVASEPVNSGLHRFRISFHNLLGGIDVEELACEDGTTPLSGGAGCSVSTLAQGEPSDLQEYAADGTLLGTFGKGVLDFGDSFSAEYDGASVAYNPTLDRVYVLQEGAHPSVAALGPAVTGTAPDATIEDPSAVGVSSAHFAGKVNPQGTSSQWRFQWRKKSQTWAEATSSPAESLPVDSSEHTVEYTTEALRGNTAYEVRLVAANTANQLLGISGEKPFETVTAPQAPTVTIDAPSAITAHTAKIIGTVNPRGDTADWRVQTSTDPACATGFTDQPLQEISTASSSPVPVEYELTGLLGADHYCARIVSTNSAGSTTSAAKEFETLDSALTQAFTAYASRRSDTSALLNGYVNPEGSEATYRFEYSEDGTTWTALSDQKTPRVREQTVVGEEATGLAPGTEYRYRFEVENGAGTVRGDEKTFTIRTSDEMQLPERGIELVNKPDKGNQNPGFTLAAVTAPLVSADGNRARWLLKAGAPEGNSGTEVNFLATRTPNGWVSKALLPAAQEQPGGGSYFYRVTSVTPDFRHFVLRGSQPAGIQAGPPTYIRLDDNQHAERLSSLPSTAANEEAYDRTQITSDGSHVLMQNFESNEIEDIGDGAPEVVSIMPDGTPSQCGVRFTLGAQWRSTYTRMAQTDASRLYFESVPNGLPCATGRRAIFYRDRNADRTVEVDPGSAESPASAMIRATPDGRSLYFVTKVSHAGNDTNGAADIYRWDASDESYSCLTCVVADPGLVESGAEPVDPPAAVLISDDFSHIYFLSNRELIPGYGTEGQVGLYVLSGGELRFVASGVGNVTANGELSGDGNVLVWFQENNKTRLTSDPLADQCRSVLSSSEFEPCHEFYRYEDSTESLECISCAAGRATVNTATSPGWLRNQALSSDGSTTAFVTKEALVPEDINSTYDIYEWRNGAVGLVSDGETAFPSGPVSAPKAYGIDATGANIFFWVDDPGLTGYEQDRYVNLYDARIGGGFPRPQPEEHCPEESCQGPLQAPPARSVAGSSGLSGAGNVAAAGRGRCASKRGRARRRCLHPRRHRRKRHHHRRHAAHRAAKRTDGGAK